jgi:hypothetical protein
MKVGGFAQGFEDTLFHNISHLGSDFKPTKRRTVSKFELGMKATSRKSTLASTPASSRTVHAPVAGSAHTTYQS